MKLLYKSVLIMIFFTGFAVAQNLLQSGPVVGYSAMREVCLWVQTTKSAKVKFCYWNLKTPDKRFFTKEVVTKEADAFSVKLICDNLDEGDVYNYSLFINDKKIDRPYELKFQTQKLWQWRSDPPNFSFVTGSCAYINEDSYDRPGKPYGGDYQIFKSISRCKPDFMIWLGDNTYLREVDWDSWSGILKRSTHTRSLQEMQAMWGSIHHYATWDDHDFGPNDSDRGFWNKEKTLAVFKIFWPNPSFGINDKPGVTTFFTWADIDFFLLDDRYYKTPNGRTDIDKTILGDEQIEWLIDNLAYSKAPFKVIAIGGQFINPNSETESFARAPKDREKILNAIDKNKIEGVVFITGDVHHSEISKLERKDAYPLYDFTISPFTSSVAKALPNPLRIDSTLFMGRNFAKFNFGGISKNRVIIYDVNGKEVKNFSINENELRYKK
jgi:alkaline phosphatase D